MLNSISVMGRLVRDPDLKQTPSGVDVCNFTIACDRDYLQGDEKVADFFDVVAWRHTGKFVGTHFVKGRMIVVNGKLQSRKYTDKNGNNRTAYEIVADNAYFADSKKDGQNGPAPAPAASNFSELTDSPDDLPF